MANLNLDERIRGRSRIAVARAGGRLESTLQATSPVDKGTMRNQTRVFPRGPLTLEIVVATDYASYVRDGTQPHFIFPTNKQYLAFYWDRAPANMGRLPDGRVLARAVRHPGTDPDPWYETAISRMPEFIDAELASIPT